MNYTGRASIATAVNGQVPAPVLRIREGDNHGYANIESLVIGSWSAATFV